jgi:hypothetical protein
VRQPVAASSKVLGNAWYGRSAAAQARVGAAEPGPPGCRWINEDVPAPRERPMQSLRILCGICGRGNCRNLDATPCRRRRCGAGPLSRLFVKDSGMAREHLLDRSLIQPCNCFGMAGVRRHLKPKNFRRRTRWTSMKLWMPRYEFAPGTTAKMVNRTNHIRQAIQFASSQPGVPDFSQ